MAELSLVEKVNEEIKVQLSNESVSRALVATTFKGLTPVLMKQALMEGMIRGYSFDEFVKRDVYALPFNGKTGPTYSLVTSIDRARKIASRTGQFLGKTAPKYEYDENGAILSCEITVKRLVSGQVGEFSAMVFFKEFNSGKNLWLSKPAVMIAKVAEMHALRSAFPEEMSKQYVEEEFDREVDNSFSSRFSESKVEGDVIKMGNLEVHEENNKEDDHEEVIDITDSK